MTLTLALQLLLRSRQEEEELGALITCGIGLIMVAIVVSAIIIYRKKTAHTVPPDKIIVITAHEGGRRLRIIYPGGTYHPHKSYNDDNDHEHSLLPRTDIVWKHLVTWRIDPNNFERYLNCHYLVRPVSYSNDGASAPIHNFRTLFATVPDIDFTTYAAEYGVIIEKIVPPLGTVKTVPGVPIGICYCHKDNVTLYDEDRKQHAYVAGKTKSGKSTLLFNMALQDIRQGKGVAFIDPHGDTVNQLLAAIPKERAQDVIYLSGSHPIPLNIMEARTDTEREILSDDIYTLIRGMSDTWGERMDAILTNTLSALMSAGDGSFIDIYHFLSDEQFRQRVLRRVENPAILRFWAAYHPPNYPRGSEQPILSRMEKFVTRPTLSQILGSSSGVDLYDVMQSGKILLVDTSRRSMGQHTGAVLGGLIVTKLYQTAMRRADIQEAQRRPFYLYVDEFQSFIATKTELILSETRKYGISMTLAHQYLSQIDEASRKAIFGNVGTMIFFQLGYDDAKYLSHQLGPYEVNNILNLSIDEHQALVRPAKGAAHTYMIRTHPPAKADQDLSASILSSQPQLHPPAPPKPPEDEDDDVDPGILPPQ